MSLGNNSPQNLFQPARLSENLPADSPKLISKVLSRLLSELRGRSQSWIYGLCGLIAVTMAARKGRPQHLLRLARIAKTTGAIAQIFQNLDRKLQLLRQANQIPT